jgi:PAS domain S-box-containing protein
MELLKKAEQSSLFFVKGVQKMMTELDGKVDSSENIYAKYKKTLTPPAVLSRKYFTQIKNIMDKYFKKISNNLENNLSSNKKLIIVANIIALIIIILTMLFIFKITLKQVINKNKINRLNKILSKYVIYSKTDLKGVITEVSEAFCKIAKYEEEELLGKAHSIIRHANVPNDTFKNMWETIQKDEIWQGEIENKAKDGTNYWVDVIISPDYDDYGNKIGYIAVRHDITANKKIAMQTIQLMESEKMASLGEMIGNIAHQWRQPLSIITTAASGILLKKEYDILEDSFLEKTLLNVEKNAQYLSKTIDTFRNFIKDNKEKKDVNIIDTIDSTVDIVSSSLKDNHITLKNQTETVKEIKYNLIAGEFIQVIINIINNAKDALLEKNISDPWIEIKIENDSKNITITIEDNAGGVDEKYLNRIFEPYFTTKHKSQGTGLGLHMSYRIITESLNGNIYVKNTNYGAKFYIELPL